MLAYTGRANTALDRLTASQRGLVHVDRKSKRLIKTRTAALLGTVLVHGLMIMWVLSVNAFLPIANPSQTIHLLTVKHAAQTAPG